MQRFTVVTDKREQMVDVTDRVREIVGRSSLHEGAVVVYCPHTTAGMTINENADPDVVTDLLGGLGRLAPRDGGWRHAEGNSDAHVKATLVGSSVTVPVSGGDLALGMWQAIYLCEFDGPRSRTVTVQMVRG